MYPVVRENSKYDRDPVELPNSSKALCLAPAPYGLRYSPISQGELLIQAVETPVAEGFSVSECSRQQLRGQPVIVM